ncbi:Translocation protein sec72 [Termitomyces sp. J132]|nr:hypothetical protein H2248_010406 [Termitomyces sp. 'cryptogamus']KNZ72553.1 Translocation protein sec72 [Termitomyces sp. J132]
MSHSHSHAPGQTHSHTHSHELPQSPQSPQAHMMPTPDPALQALIDEDFRPVPLSLSDDRNTAHCLEHRLEKCDACNIDFVNLNRLSILLANNPNLLCPPPSNVVTQKLSQMVTTTKDEGNSLFKSGLHTAAVNRYSAAANLAINRPPWENNQVMREELSTVVSNRSAAFTEANDHISALADAEAVLQIRKPWSKGHFRKAKALVGLHRLRDAAEAVKLGLSFEPNNNELLQYHTDIEKAIVKKGETKQATAEPKSEQ